MPTDKYTRIFSDFKAYPWPGRNQPEYYDYKADAGDGYGGLQWMFQHILAAYGPRHVISGIQVQTGGSNSVTGTAGYYMWDGEIKSWSAKSGTITANQYAYISDNGTLNFASTGEYNSGLIIAVSGEGGIKNITQRWDGNKLLYSLIDKLQTSQLTGEYINSSQITGDYALINIFKSTTSSGSQVTGTYGLFSDVVTTTINGAQITGTSGLIYNLQNLDNINNNTYFCSSQIEVENSLATIGSNAGTIVLAPGTITLTSPISISGGGLYTIKGQGDGTIIDCAGDRSAITLTAATGCILKNFRVDGTDLASFNTNIISINEASNHRIYIKNLFLEGPGLPSGNAIKIDSDYVTVESCKLKNLYAGVILNGVSGCHIRDNEINAVGRGSGAIYLINSINNIIIGNVLESVDLTGIFLETSVRNHIIGNSCNNVNGRAIWLDASNNNIINANNCNYCNDDPIRSEGDYNNIYGNICNYNTGLAIIYISGNYNIVNGNICNYNSGITIYLYDDFNIANGNICCNNIWETDVDVGSIKTYSNQNTLNGNAVFGFTNPGAGTGYGIQIAGTENTVIGNTATGNVGGNFQDDGGATFTGYDNVNNFT